MLVLRASSVNKNVILSDILKKKSRMFVYLFGMNFFILLLWVASYIINTLGNNDNKGVQLFSLCRWYASCCKSLSLLILLSIIMIDKLLLLVVMVLWYIVCVCVCYCYSINSNDDIVATGGNQFCCISEIVSLRKKRGLLKFTALPIIFCMYN